MSIIKFNLRVYALIINEKKEILLSDEFRFGNFFTKFPGGGVELGEGIIDALHREMSEELNLELNDFQFFYVNDFYQGSAFDEKQQIVSFYYKTELKKSKFLTEPYCIPFFEEGEKQRWVNIDSLTEKELTFPIDKLVLNKLKTSN